MRTITIFLLLLLVFPFSFLQVVRSDGDAVEVTDEGGGSEIVDNDDADMSEGHLVPASGVDTVCIFPSNFARLVTAGEDSELLVGVKNDGESSLNIIAIKSSLHLPYDHRLQLQNLTVQSFNNLSTPASTQATYPYIFAVSKYLQPGTYDLVGTIVYEIDSKPYQNTFYNGTIEVVDVGSFLNIESVFLVTLGIGLVALASLWVYGQIQNLSKKTKRAPKMETGTGLTDATLDEWLQGTAYTQSQLNKSKKKK